MIFPVVLGTGMRVFGGRRSAHDPRTGWRDDRRWDASRTYIALRAFRELGFSEPRTHSPAASTMASGPGDQDLIAN
jgi:hypothetical protein